MSNYLVTDTELISTANAIREKTGSSDNIIWNEATGFSAAIDGIPSGGGSSVAPNDVNFYDYDGTIVASYSAADFANLSAMPDNPTHEGLIALGWNWALSRAKDYVAWCGMVNIGQMYITDDGKTRIYVHFEEGRSSAYLYLCVDGTVDIDWGDGSAHGTMTGSSTDDPATPIQHNWQPGDYVISLTPEPETQFSFYGDHDEGCCLLLKQFGSGEANQVYRNAIKRIELGEGLPFLNSYSFLNCYCLTSITIPFGVDVIDGSAFENCFGLKSITIPNSVATMGSAIFASCYGLASIAMQDYLYTIPSAIFAFCYGLASIAMPYDGDTIESSAFENCTGLASVTIPPSVSMIENYAFGNCHGLGEVHFLPTTPPILFAETVWDNLPADCTIFVPVSALADYLTKDYYPTPLGYTYIGFGTYASGAALPSQDTTQAYDLTWYATKADALAQTNAITTGNGREVYCRYIEI